MTRHAGFLWLVGLAALLYVGAAPRFYVGHFGDDARDILAAKSILQGSYRNLQVPGHPFLNFPLPGFPLLLAPFVALFSSHFEWLKIIPIALCLGSMVLLSRLGKADLSPRAATFLGAAFAFNPTTLMLSGCVISDAPYLFAVLSAFVLLRSDPGPRRDTLLGVAAGGAGILRPEGAILIFSLAAGLLWTRQWKPLRGVFGALGLLLSVLLWNALRTGSPSGYLPLINAMRPSLFQGVGALASNVGALLKSLVFDVLLGLSVEIRSPFQRALAAALVGGALAAIAMGCGRWLKARQTPPALGLAVALYAFFHLWVHGIWRAVDAHYLWPLLPFAAFFLIYAIDHMRAGRRKTAAGVFLSVLVFGLYARQTAFAIRQTLDSPAENRLPQGSFAWIRSRTPLDAFILSPQASLLTLYTGRYSMVVVGGQDPDDFRSRLLDTGITYILASPPPRFLFVETAALHDPLTAWRRAQAWLASEPLSYEPVYRSEAEMIDLYRVRPAPEFQEAYAMYRRILQSIAAANSSDPSVPLDQLEAVVRLNPFPSALNAYGAAALLSGRHLTLAQGRLQQAVKRRPDFVTAWVNLARVDQRLGLQDRARAAYAQALDHLGAGQNQLNWSRGILQESQALSNPR